MKKGTKIGIGVAIGVGVIGAIAFYVSKQIQYAKKLRFSVGKVKAQVTSISEVDMDMAYVVKNLDKLSVLVTSLSVDVFVKGKLLTNVTQNTPTRIAPNATTELPLKMKIDPKEFLSDPSLLLGGGYKSIKVQFKGVTKVKKLGISFGIPYNETFTIGQLLAN